MNEGAANSIALAAFALHFVLGVGANFVLPRRRAILFALLAGFLFLPSVEFDLAGAISWNRVTAPVLTAWIGILLLDHARLARFRPRLWDLPIAVWCLSAGVSVLSNDFTIYDAASAVFYRSITWLGPYLIGRLHFSRPEDVPDLAKAAALGAALYVPFCAWEIVFGPQFHMRLYGFQQHDWLQSVRGDFFRPLVFLQHGLMTTMWMATGALCAWVLWLRDRRDRLLGLPLLPFALVLTATVLASQSMGTTLLFLAALGVTWATRTFGLRAPLLALGLIPGLWVALRATDVLSTGALSGLAARFSEERAASFQYRLETEDRLLEHAADRPLLGWSTWERDRIVTVDYEDRAIIVDGLWIIALSQNGYLGLLALLAAHLAPLLVVLRWAPFLPRGDGDVRLATILATLVGITMVDHLVNAMIAPYPILLLGAVPGLARALAGGSGPAEEEAAAESAEPGPRLLGG